jgi:hypothetical protein
MAFSGTDDRYARISAHSKVNGRKEIINLRIRCAVFRINTSIGVEELTWATEVDSVVKRSGRRAIAFNVDAGA